MPPRSPLPASNHLRRQDRDSGRFVCRVEIDPASLNARNSTAATFTPFQVIAHKASSALEIHNVLPLQASFRTGFWVSGPRWLRQQHNDDDDAVAIARCSSTRCPYTGYSCTRSSSTRCSRTSRSCTSYSRTSYSCAASQLRLRRRCPDRHICLHRLHPAVAWSLSHVDSGGYAGT